MSRILNEYVDVFRMADFKNMCPVGIEVFELDSIVEELDTNDVQADT